jgi:hypothetical protein
MRKILRVYGGDAHPDAGVGLGGFADVSVRRASGKPPPWR